MLHEDSKTTDRHGALRLALGIAAAYAVFGMAWILLSDAAVVAVSTDPAWLTLAQRYKGLFYVLITAAGLAALVHVGARRLVHADHEARSSQLRVQDLFLQHPQPMWLFDKQSLAFLKVNQAAIAQYGYTEAEFLGMTLKEIRPPEDIALLFEFVKPPMSSHRDIGIVRHCKKSGEIIHAQITVYPVPYEGGTAVMAMAIDMTHEVMLKRAMEHQEAQFRQLHQSLGEVLWLASVDGQKLLYLSPALERVYGVPAADFERNPRLWLEMVHPDDRARAAASSARLLADGHASCEYRICRPDGSVRWIADRKKVIVDEQGQAKLIGGIAEDISAIKATEDTLRRQADELARRNAELERFNQATVGRELDMIELKREVNRLSQQLGQPSPHALAFLDPSGQPER